MSHNENIEEYKIVQKILGNKGQGFEALIDRYHPVVCRLLRRRVPIEEVEGLVQECFILIYQSLPDFKGMGSLEGWIRRIGARVCCDYWRKNERDKLVTIDREDQERTGYQASLSVQSYLEKTNLEEIQQVVRLTLRKLKPEDQLLLEWVYFDELPLADVAYAMKWSLTRTKVSCYRARQRLKKILSECFGEEL